MSATVTKRVLLGNRLFLSSKVEAMGTGAPADGDDLCTNLRDFPVGSEYMDTTNKNSYLRFGSAGVAADWQVIGGGTVVTGAINKAASSPAIVDNTGGAASGAHTLAAIAAGTPADLTAQGNINAAIKNDLATLAAEHNALVTALKAAGLMVTP